LKDFVATVPAFELPQEVLAYGVDDYVEVADGAQRRFAGRGDPFNPLTFTVAIEALSRDSPPKLAGSSCNYIKEITAGANPSLLAATIRSPAVPVACEPRVER
jgi:hypothetical protein